MSADGDSIDELLDSMSRGVPIDWDSATTGADPEARPRIETLRDISGIASFNRMLQRGDESSRSAPPAAEIPDRWGDLIVLEWIGRRGRADVYRAWASALQCDVALQLLPAEDATGTGVSPERVQAVASLRHPNLVPIYGLDRRDARLGVWMELRHAMTLERAVRRRGPLAADDVVRLGIDLGSALAAVHGAGLPHGAVDAANVLQDGDGRFVLGAIDVVGATLAGGAAGPGASRPAASSARALSPEQLDLRALGGILAFAATGRPSSGGEPSEERDRSTRLGGSTQAIPSSLADVVDRAMMRGPGDGFASAVELIGALETVRSGATPQSEGTESPVPGRTAPVSRLAGLMATVRSVWHRGGRRG